MFDRVCYALASVHIQLAVAGAFTFGMTFVCLAVGVR